MSTISSGLTSLRAYASASASVSRPSASVLLISIVLPFMARSTSPGLVAEPDGMFSVAATSPCTSTGGRSRGSTLRTPRTAAAPDMSPFMRTMPSAVLRSSPPESNVMPLPISAIRRRAVPRGTYARWMNRGGSTLPRLTPRNAPMPIFSQAARSKTRTRRPASRAMARAASARAVAVTWFAGSLMRSRAKQVASAPSSALRTPWRAAPRSRAVGTRTVRAVSARSPGRFSL